MEFEGKDYNIVKLLSKLDEKYLLYLVVLCVGAVISVCGVIAPISTWILFPKTRNFQNFIALNRCFTSTLLCLLKCVEASFVYYLNRILCDSYKDDNNMEDHTRTSDLYNKFFQYVVGLCGYAYISLCCWNTIDSLLCLVSVMKFASKVPWKYVVVILVCYVTPAPLLAIQARMALIASSEIFIIVLLSEIVVINFVNTCIYTCVAIGMFRGKKPGQGETVGTITASLIIFIIFGLGYAVISVINLCDELHTLISPSDSLENFVQNEKVLYGILCLLVSIMPLVLSVFYVIVRRDNRKFWTQCFTKNSAEV